MLLDSLIASRKNSSGENDYLGKLFYSQLTVSVFSDLMQKVNDAKKISRRHF